MTTADYLINLLFVLIVARQALDRRIDRRYFVIPIVLVFWVGSQYLHTLPTAGNDLVLAAALASVGLTLGTISGLATHIRRDRDGIAFARVGWLAGILLVAGISSRMVFAFAISHGLEPAVRSFSITNHISGAAWPVAMVAMALCEVGARRPDLVSHAVSMGADLQGMFGASAPTLFAVSAARRAVHATGRARTENCLTGHCGCPFSQD